ncbi:MAG: phosphate regulon transcriptional regulator PhoB [Rhodothalassiaceae bacterium]
MTRGADRPARILLIEDDASLGELIRYNLAGAGYAVEIERDGEEGLQTALGQPPDLAIIDWMLPNLSGIEICRRLRRNEATANLPIILLTARAEETDRVRGLETGADDYITKPFSPRELVARVRAVLRRVRPALSGKVLAQGDITLDTASHRVTRRGENIHLGPTEYRLLRHFLENPGRVFTREQLLDAVWGHDVYVERRTVDVHIRRLRKALMQDGGSDPIRTVRAAGYAFDPDAARGLD